MPRVNFYPEKRKAKTTGNLITQNVPIILDFNFDGKRFQYYTGERVDVKNWDNGFELVKGKKKRIHHGKVKRNTEGSQQINQYLDMLAERVSTIYRNGKILGDRITTDYIRTRISEVGSSARSIYELFDEYIANKRNEYAYGFIKGISTVKNHLYNYSIARKKKLDFDSINISFFENFIDYLIHDCQHTHNTVASIVKRLKFFLKYATEKGYNKNLEYTKFSMSEKETAIVFLTWDELMVIYNLDIKSEALRQVRDVFCFGCFTGLRYSDIYNLKKENIKNDFLYINTIKTKETNTIPLNDYSREIINRYKGYPGNKALPVISNQKMNEYLKDLGKLAKLNEFIPIVHFRGAERIENTFPKYDLLTTHIARKTFITNALKLGMQTEVIMSITGHKNHKSFKRYYKILDEHKLNAMQTFFKKEEPKKKETKKTVKKKSKKEKL